MIIGSYGALESCYAYAHCARLPHTPNTCTPEFDPLLFTSLWHTRPPDSNLEASRDIQAVNTANTNPTSHTTTSSLPNIYKEAQPHTHIVSAAIIRYIHRQKLWPRMARRRFGGKGLGRSCEELEKKWGRRYRAGRTK